MISPTGTTCSRKIGRTIRTSGETRREGTIRRRILLAGIGFGTLLSLSPLSIAAVITVDLRGGEEHTGIQRAIDAAADGDTVLVKPGDYVIAEPLTFRGKAITVRGENGAKETTIRMSGTPLDPSRRSVAVFDSGESETSVLEGFTLTRGAGLGDPRSSHGGGVYCAEGAAPSLVNCTITGNSVDGRGGGVYCEASSPVLMGCAITRNSATDRGGGVHCRDSSPLFTNCTITRNSSESHGGGVYCQGSSPLLSRSTITGNSAESRGGGLYCGLRSSPTLSSCIVWDNLAQSIHSDESTPRVIFSCIEGAAVWPGEGNINADPLFCGWDTPRVFVNDQRGFEEALGSPFSLALSARSPCIGSGEGGVNMGADNGSCDVPGELRRLVRLAPGRYRIDGLDLFHRVSLEGEDEAETVIEGTVLGLRTGSFLSRLTVTAGTQGGIRVGYGQSPEIISSTIRGNSGSGVYCSKASPLLAGCTITGNSGERGAGVYCSEGSSPTLVDCVITGNLAFGSGGGVSTFDGSPRLVNCTIAGNSSLSGGGISCLDSSPTLMSCTITGNSARGDGGGVTSRRSSPTLANCTIAGNLADSGGGLYLSNSSGSLVNCTITGNSAREEGGGLSCFSSAVRPTNCIVWDNTGGPISMDPDSSVQASYSCIDAREVWPGLGNINLYPRFEREGVFDFERIREVEIGGRLRDGPDFVVSAPDYHLQPGSPCIDSGSLEEAPDTDSEENGRPCGAGVDMGAFEMGACPPVRFVRGDCNGDTGVNLTDAVCLLNWLFAGGEEPACVAAVNTDGDSSATLSDAIHLLNFLFVAGEPPARPFPDCAPGPLVADKTLGCVRSPAGCE